MKTVWRVKYEYWDDWEEIGIYISESLAQKALEKFLEGKSDHYKSYTYIWEEEVYHN